MYDKSNREKLGRIGSQIEAILSRAKAANSRGLTSEERTSFHALETEFSQLEDTIKINERGHSIVDRLRRVGDSGGIDEIGAIQDSFRLPPGARRDMDPHARAFSAYLRKGLEALEQDERQIMMGRCPDPSGTARLNSFRNAMTTTTGGQGGFLIPQGFSEQLKQAKKWFGGIKGVVGKFVTETGNPWPWPTVNDTNNKGRIVGQNIQVTQTDLTFGQTTFNAYIGSSDLILMPLALTEDSFFDMDALVAELLGTRLGRLYNLKCTIGTGVTEPTGIVTAAVAGGNILTLGPGSTSAIAYANLVDLEHLVDPEYRGNPSACFMFSDTVLKLLKKLVDGNGRPLWQPGLTASFREGAGVDVVAGNPSVLGYKYIVNADMAAPAANQFTVLFGDLNTFKVREVQSGTTVLALRERYADYLQVGFIAYQRFDSTLIDAGTHPIAVLQQSAT